MVPQHYMSAWAMEERALRIAYLIQVALGQDGVVEDPSDTRQLLVIHCHSTSIARHGIWSVLQLSPASNCKLILKSESVETDPTATMAVMAKPS